MGILSGLLGNASQADIADTEEALERILADGERVEQAFRLVRDMLIFTDRRFILVDRQGVTGRKSEYHSIPYRAITQFAVESAGALDLEAELKVWISGAAEPIQKRFTRGSTIFEVQKALAAHVR
jgi:hypothetical protein